MDVIQLLLEGEGYEVITTLDGDRIEKMYEQKPDLLFLDIWMSGINGNTVCQKLKADPETGNVPIIMFSANRDTEQIAMDCGADGFLAKPFDIKDLVAMVKKYVG